MNYADGLETQTRAAFAREQQRHVDPPDEAPDDETPPATMSDLWADNATAEKARDIFLAAIEGYEWDLYQALVAIKGKPRAVFDVIDTCERKAREL